ncbi:52 kDa repressor of the inhibitor of the protein kinase-like [Rhagoletis pomonella]|uniref:52 kDa repressor of the inhibitor of the protein kinase-like n=1 Tax=Rhagoletis pomonella TaxID=28610 RepID=UPI00177FD3BC|nr:52 kDa repressor of the inhibitor of the protein kinase-like [Rhagoletis pomonella]
MRCAVVNCASVSAKGSGCAFFTFPADIELVEKWIQFCRRPTIFNARTSVICVKHFTTDDFENELQYKMGYAKKRKLKRGVVPTIFKPAAEMPDPDKEAQQQVYKTIVSDLLEQSTSKEAEGLMGHNRADEENCGILPDALTPLCSPHRATTPSKVFYYDSTLKEVEDLQEKL